ncbi:helicase HerA domain-containing protein [Haladaptatus sp. GCM10025707]|uniref:helicase HerA domain-containing protein n=1 Tax=Haladaptatus sp. GCM10025707 TaxID=3252658 RepID=UPI003614A5FF
MWIRAHGRRRNYHSRRSERRAGGEGTVGAEITLPVVEVLTGRGFITGKSGSGKSNTASVVAEKLLSNNFPILIVDTDGEYYGLKEKFELLHVGADEECDIVVGPEHAEKIASLALEGNVPIILDVSGYLDENEAKDLLTAVSKQLFAKEKKLKKPFLMLVEEVHEYLPEGPGLDECGRMLIKIGKRGRKHGLGVTGISQRPADVKKDFITQCDWLVWHRLTWGNDTKVVKRVLGTEYANAIESMGDGEAFLMTDWAETIRRVQFQRKTTFDAGATPGLDDFERPDLKSVSDSLVSELKEITDKREHHENEVERLEAKLKKKDDRIAQLESELADARDMSRMADQFAQAMLDNTQPSRMRPEEQSGLDQYDQPTANGEAKSQPQEAEDAVPEPSFEELPIGENRPLVKQLRGAISDLDPIARGMLAYYCESGPAEPMDAYVAAGGEADRPIAYNHNGILVRAGVVTHVGRGLYDYCVPEFVEAAHDGRLSDAEFEEIIEAIETQFLADAGLV